MIILLLVLVNKLPDWNAWFAFIPITCNVHFQLLHFFHTLFIPTISGTFEVYLHILALYISNCRMLLHTMIIPAISGTVLKYLHILALYISNCRML